MKIRLANYLLLIFSIIFPIFSLELLLRIFFHNEINKLSDSRWDYRSRNPQAYQNSPFYSKEFLDESKSIISFEKRENGMYVLKPKSGKYFNISKENFRLTKNFYDNKIDSKNIKNVFVFGGSTIFGEEVPDSLTIPSILSNLLYKNCKDKYIVHNRAIPSYRTKEQLNLLIKENISEKDYVVFYDGFNDFHYNIHINNPNRLNHFQIGEEATKAINLQKILYSIPILKNSAVIKFATGKIYYPSANPQKHINKSIDHYWNNINTAYKITSFKKANFIHFIQPTIHNALVTSSNSKYLVDHPTISFPNESSTFRKYFPKFKEYKKKYESFKSIDLSNIFNKIEAADIFLDHAHTNEKGNKIISKVIFNNMISNFNLHCKN